MKARANDGAGAGGAEGGAWGVRVRCTSNPQPLHASRLLYTCFTPALHLLHACFNTCFTPALHLLHARFTPLYTCSTPVLQDNGVGIAADKFDLLFQPFSQVRAGPRAPAALRAPFARLRHRGQG